MPALISDWVPMMERVRPAQLTTIVVAGSGASRPGAEHQFGAGHADRAGDVHGGIFVEAADVEDGDIGLGGDQAGDFLGGQRGRMPALLDQFAEGLGIGVDVPEQFVAGAPPGRKPAVELTDVGVSQRRRCSAAGATRPSPES